MPFPPQDLECPDPGRCPVASPADLGGPVRVMELPAGTRLYRVYDGTWGYDEPNPGIGDARFSPFDAADGHRVASMYFGETPIGVLLETVFHDVHPSATRLVYENELREMLLAHVETPVPLRLADLRDQALAEKNLRREQAVSCSSEHYPCTRLLAQHIHGQGDPEPVNGMLWHSRQSELQRSEAVLAVVVFSTRLPVSRGGWPRVGPGSQNLWEGPGRLRVSELASELDATIVSQDVVP